MIGVISCRIKVTRPSAEFGLGLGLGHPVPYCLNARVTGGDISTQWIFVPLQLAPLLRLVRIGQDTDDHAAGWQ